MTLHTECLSDQQRWILPPLGAFARSQSFYLGGGTAVALYFGHRRSVDFDWFTNESFEPLILAESLRRSGLPVDSVQTPGGTLHGLIEDVRVSFFHYPYPELGPRTVSQAPALDVASLDDLAAMKVAAIAQHGSRKDFIDLDILARQHKPIGQIIKLYQERYTVADTAHVLVALAYFDDAEDEPMPRMLTDVSWEDVRKRFRQWAKELAAL